MGLICLILQEAGVLSPFRIVAVLSCICALAISASSAAVSAQKNAVKQVPPTEDLQNILSWFPADTESLFVANGPFSFPDLEPPNQPSVFTSTSAEELKVDFEALALSLVGFRNGVLANRLMDQKVTVAVEGARHFRVPSGLGETLFEGCSVLVFARDVSDRTGSFLKESLASDHVPEQIEGQSVTVFKEQLESDTWTILLAFPKPNTILACTGRDFLREMLARMNGNRGNPRTNAFPDELPEWKYVDASTRFWAIRHFDRSQGADDPTSPLAPPKKQADVGGSSLDNVPTASAAALRDGQAIGLTFNFDPYKSWNATITYLSADPGIAAKLRGSEYFAPGDPTAAPLKPNFREVAPGVVSITYQLQDRQAVHVFRLLLSAALGHAVYL